MSYTAKDYDKEAQHQRYQDGNSDAAEMLDYAAFMAEALTAADIRADGQGWFTIANPHGCETPKHTHSRGFLCKAQPVRVPLPRPAKEGPK